MRYRHDHTRGRRVSLHFFIFAYRHTYLPAGLTLHGVWNIHDDGADDMPCLRRLPLSVHVLSPRLYAIGAQLI